MTHLIIFSSIAYSHIPDERRKKLDDKSEKCIIVTYSERFKVYKIYNPITKKLVIIRDVKFDKKKKAWNWSTNDLKGKFVCVDLEEEKQIQHDDKEVYTPPYSSNSSPSLSSPPSSSPSTSSPTNTSALLWKTKRLREIYKDSRNNFWIKIWWTLLYSSMRIWFLFEDVSKEEKWKNIMDQKIDIIKRNKTWELV